MDKKSWVDKSSAINIKDILDARGRISKFDFGEPVKVVFSTQLDGKSDFGVINALDTSVANHSFKWRGAANFFQKLVEERSSAGSQDKMNIIAFSAGNHAQGVAMAARFLGEKGDLEKVNIGKVKIYMPETTPEVKYLATKKLGGEFVDIVSVGQDFNEAKKVASKEFSQSSNNLLVPPYDHRDIVAGQGTLAIELLEQVVGKRDLPDSEFLNKNSSLNRKLNEIFGKEGEDLVLHVPGGGGGLLAGTALVIKKVLPEASIIAVEPEYSPSLTKALIEREPFFIENVPSEIDGIGTASGVTIEQIGDIPFGIIKNMAISAQTVNNDQLLYATRLLNDEEVGIGFPVEQSGSLGTAAMLNNEDKLSGKVVINIITGGNIGEEELEKLDKNISLEQDFPKQEALLSYRASNSIQR